MNYGYKGFIKCEGCLEMVPRSNQNARFCGSYRQKTGCSYKNHLAKKIAYGHPQRRKAALKNPVPTKIER